MKSKSQSPVADAAWAGADELRPMLRDVSTLKADPKNARIHPARNLDVIAQSLKRFGQRKPIVVSEDGTVIAGNGLLHAARALAWTHVAVAVYAGSAAELAAYALTDNRSAELAAWDRDVLKQTLEELQPHDDLLIGWSSDELVRFLALEQDTAAQLGAMEYRVIIDCADETQQRELLERFEQEGLKCRGLIS